MWVGGRLVAEGSAKKRQWWSARREQNADNSSLRLKGSLYAKATPSGSVYLLLIWRVSSDLETVFGRNPRSVEDSSAVAAQHQTKEPARPGAKQNLQTLKCHVGFFIDN